jgi:hypothetical protein
MIFQPLAMTAAALLATASGWLMYREILWPVAALVALDWGLRAFWNGIRGKRAEADLSRLALGVLSLSFFAAVRLGWVLLMVRIAFHTAGLVERERPRRFVPALLFAGCAFAYPIAVERRPPTSISARSTAGITRGWIALASAATCAPSTLGEK